MAIKFKKSLNLYIFFLDIFIECYFPKIEKNKKFEDKIYN